MQNIQTYWKWIALIVVLAIIFGASSLPWPVVMLTMGAAGGYLVYMGWQIWQRSGGGGLGDSKRVTYWRGQRIELDKGPRRPSTPPLRTIWPVILYVLLGGILVFSALVMLFDRGLA